MTAVPAASLRGGVELPLLGFGVFLVPPEDTAAAVTTALEAGYRSIDTAAAYRNEKGVGEALAASGIPRDEVAVTTKLWNSQQGYDETLAAFEGSIGRLGLDHVDLYLIHWPVPAEDKYVDTWRAFERIQSEGRAKAIGVSNFGISHLERVMAETGVVPALNQIELHPRLQQRELRAFHAEHGIVTEAWSPLARGGELLADPVVTGIAAAHGVTPAQVVLRWHVQQGIVAIPKSVNPERIRANLDVFGFELHGAEIDAMSGLDTGGRIGPDPNEFTGL
jgi:2,5-diketo-D-gluconate reductase A